MSTHANAVIPENPVTELRAMQLLELANGNRLYVRVPNFVTEEVSRQARNRFEAAVKDGNTWAYSEHNIYAIGNSISSLEDSAEGRKLRDITFGDDPDGADDVRRLFYPYASPIDSLIIRLMEIWPKGVAYARPDGRNVPMGIVRSWRESAFIGQHQDVPTNRIFNVSGVEFQLAVNVYLEAPTVGGKLQLWSKGYERSRYLQMKSVNAITPSTEKPDVELQPESGDLIIFCSNRLHAVTAQKEGMRYTASFFIGYKGPGSPLLIWS